LKFLSLGVSDDQLLIENASQVVVVATNILLVVCVATFFHLLQAVLVVSQGLVEISSLLVDVPQGNVEVHERAN
jgi:hypothetical protein